MEEGQLVGGRDQWLGVRMSSCECCEGVRREWGNQGRFSKTPKWSKIGQGRREQKLELFLWFSMWGTEKAVRSLVSVLGGDSLMKSVEL